MPQVDVYSAGQGESDDEGRRSEVIGPHFRMHTALEIPVAAEDSSHDQVPASIAAETAAGRPTIADARGAPVAHEEEAELFQVGQQSGFGQVVCYHFRAGARLVLTQGFVCKPRSTAFLASRPAAISTAGLDVFVQLVMAAMTTEPWCKWRPVSPLSAGLVSLPRGALPLSPRLCGTPGRIERRGLPPPLLPAAGERVGVRGRVSAWLC